MRFGIALPPSGQISELTSLASSIERLGCDWLWINEDRLQKDSFTVLAALAASTDSIRSCPGAGTNPFTRHPALIASAIATLDELSGGRAVLGLGAGGTNHRMLGLEAPRAGDCTPRRGHRDPPVDRRRERHVQGGTVRTRDAELDFDPVRDQIPLYIGARGPKILELGGEVADGVIVGNVANGLGYGGTRFSGSTLAPSGRAATERRSSSSRGSTPRSTTRSGGSARGPAVRHMVATTLVTSRPILEQLGVELPPPFAPEMERAHWQLSSSVIGPASLLVPDELIGKFALAGTAAECRESLERLARCGARDHRRRDRSVRDPEWQPGTGRGAVHDRVAANVKSSEWGVDGRARGLGVKGNRRDHGRPASGDRRRCGRDARRSDRRGRPGKRPRETVRSRPGRRAGPASS